MPKDNIDRAIKKGAGELDGAIYEEIIYEGYGPHNVAIIVEVMTDNRNRTIASVRHAFSKCNGNLGSANSVQYMFDRMGSIMIEKTVIEEDLLTDLILEAGADDINTENPDAFQIITSPADFDTVRSYLEEKEVAMLSAEVIWNPQNRVEIDDSKKAEQVIKLIDILEDDEDVNSVHSNFDISDNVMAELG
jgi:YebC/PmpR family DNA-binding regulatory protein